MNIAYVTTYDASDVHNWSGSGYFIAKALKEQGAEIGYVGNLQAKPSLLLKVKSSIHRLGNRRFPFDRESSIARQYAKKAAGLIRPEADIIFCPGTIPIAYLKSEKPTVFYTDATFAGMIGFYDSFSHLSKETIRHGNSLEQRALDMAKLAIYSSEWAARSAIENYRVDPDKVKVVPFGANIECSRNLQEIKKTVSGRSAVECHLLFLGVDWERKRGDFAVQVAQLLNARGLKTVLHVAGIKDLSKYSLPDFVIDHGFISKSTREGVNKIDHLLSTCHFLLLPTKAECYGLVFCEASSFGLPSIATEVGGVSTVIHNDINGKTFPLSVAAPAYADYILSVFTNRGRYEELSLSSFQDYKNRLNWEVAGKAIMKLLRSM